MNWLTKRVLRWLQRRCRHEQMVADVLEGCAEPHEVAWCPTCGALRIKHARGYANQRQCEPTWS